MNLIPEFSASGYMAIIKAAKAAGYTIIPMREAFAAGEEKRIILRHDLDLSLDYALDMAALEADENIKAAYFVLPYNDFYNPFSPNGRAKIHRLSDMGHEIGLHWDATLYPLDRAGATKAFMSDVERLADIAGQAIRSASKHIPTDSPPFAISELIEIDTYSPKLNARYTYVSDSNMSWRDATPLELIANEANIHFLAHPTWWMAAGNSMEKKMKSLEELHIAAVREGNNIHLRYLEDCLARRQQLDNAYLTQNY